MEYLEGVELGSVIEREGALDPARAIKIASQICRALSAAHAQNIIHRDLKPENIFLINRDGAADFVKVLDFGIAKTTEAEQARERKLTSPGMAMGTPEYMSPEQAAGRAADARCDVYALGAILYEMLTGVPPYQGDNFMEILTKKATVDPVPTNVLRPGVPDQVNVLVMAAMARNPDERPQTMEGFEYELTKCLAGRGAAVAQILGLGMDAQLVANLNPGLSPRVLDEGTVTRPGSSPGLSLPEHPRAQTGGPVIYTTPVPGVLEGVHLSERMPAPPRSSSQMGAAAMPLEMAPTAVVTTEPVERSGSALGWVLLALVLFAGVGIMLYVASGERDGQRAPVTAPSGSDGSAAPPPAGSGTTQTPDTGGSAGGTQPAIKTQGTTGTQGSATPSTQGSAAAGSGKPTGKDGGKDSGRDGGKDSGKDGKDAGKSGTSNATTQNPDATKTPKKPATSETDARAILKTAEKLRTDKKYAAAWDEFGRVAASTYLPGSGMLGQARVAMDQAQYD
jgi:serine/threonine-protein kinase